MILRFHDFELDPRERLLKRQGQDIPVSPKTLDTLLVLLESPGALVPRATLRERLWPGMIVEEGNLARVSADARKALDDTKDQRQFIETVPKFGYRFIAPVERVPSKEAACPAVVPGAPMEREALAVRPPAASSTRIFRTGLLAGVVLVLALVSGAGNRAARRRFDRPIQSLLIAPFDAIGSARDSELLPFGLADCLTTELSAMSDVAVRRSHAMEDANGPRDPVELGLAARADAVLTGSVQIAGARVHVNARLLRTADGHALRTGSFDETSEDVIRIEATIAKQTAVALTTTLSATDTERLERRLPTNPEAHRYYLLGRHNWNKRSEAGYATAVAMFTKAAQTDPSFAGALTGIADTYLLMGGNEGTHAENVSMARSALRRALEINPDLGEAHATLGLLAESRDFDWNEAERQFRTAIRRSPSYATAHHWYGEFLSMMGKFDLAEAEFNIARDLDPVSAIILTDAAQLYVFEHDYPRALRTLTEALAIDPGFHLAIERKGYVLMLMCRPSQAIEAFSVADRMAGRPSSAEHAAWAAAVAGRREEAIRFLEAAGESHPSALLVAAVWAQLGDSDRAMDWLTKAVAAHWAGIVSVKVNPVFDPLRSDPRFKDMLRRMNLT